jgi:type II secretory pathway component PulJ
VKNEKNYKYIIVIIILSVCLFFSTAFFLGTGISANRRYRAELERSARLEQTVREQESRIRESSECIRRTRDELGDIIQSSNGRIENAITGIQELRKTMQYLENDYNSMRDRLSNILDDLDNNGSN